MPSNLTPEQNELVLNQLEAAHKHSVILLRTFGQHHLSDRVAFMALAWAVGNMLGAADVKHSRSHVLTMEGALEATIEISRDATRRVLAAASQPEPADQPAKEPTDADSL